MDGAGDGGVDANHQPQGLEGEHPSPSLTAATPAPPPGFLGSVPQYLLDLGVGASVHGTSQACADEHIQPEEQVPGHEPVDDQESRHDNNAGQDVVPHAAPAPAPASNDDDGDVHMHDVVYLEPSTTEPPPVPDLSPLAPFDHDGSPGEQAQAPDFFGLDPLFAFTNKEPDLPLYAQQPAAMDVADYQPLIDDDNNNNVISPFSNDQGIRWDDLEGLDLDLGQDFGARGLLDQYQLDQLGPQLPQTDLQQQQQTEEQPQQAQQQQRLEREPHQQYCEYKRVCSPSGQKIKTAF